MRPRAPALPFLGPDDPFPPVETAWPNGLLALGATLRPERLLDAYGRGIFPWYEAGQPILWWAPDPRAVLEPAALRIPRSLRKALRRTTLTLSSDRAFDQVVRHCAAPRRGAAGLVTGTWITPDMRAAYNALHRLGYAHSLECWQDGALVGGLYGIALGRVFFGESMFSRRPDASKIAFVALARHLQAQGFAWIDCQLPSELMQRLGARMLPMRQFTRELQAAGCRDADASCWTPLGSRPAEPDAPET